LLHCGCDAEPVPDLVNRNFLVVDKDYYVRYGGFVPHAGRDEAVMGTDSGFRSSGLTQSFEALFFDIGTHLVPGGPSRTGQQIADF
jgi:hypothetical protein